MSFLTFGNRHLLFGSQSNHIQISTLCTQLKTFRFSVTEQNNLKANSLLILSVRFYKLNICLQFVISALLQGGGEERKH